MSESESLLSPLQIIAEKLQNWWVDLIGLMPNIIIAVVILFIFLKLSKPIKKLVRNVLHRTHTKLLVIQLVSGFAQGAVVAIGFLVVLSVLNLDKAVTSILAGAGVAGLALGFALQDVVSNLMSGVFLAAQSPLKVGDFIEIGDKKGVVIATTLRTTELEMAQGQRVFVPNKDIFQGQLINYTRTGNRRVEVLFGLAYDTDLDKAQRLITKTVLDLPESDDNKPIDCYYTDLGDSSINGEVHFWLDKVAEGQYLQAKSQAIKAIKNDLEAAHIEIPYPVRTIITKSQ